MAIRVYDYVRGGKYVYTFRPIYEIKPFLLLLFYFLLYVFIYGWLIGLRLTKTSLTLINRTRLRTKGQFAGYPQAQIEITSYSFQRRAP